jgi:tetratricopeptide (TPR) repeat protein
MTVDASQKNETDPEAAVASFAQGEQYLKTALDAGFKDEDGNIYYYLFHCYYGQKSKGADVYFPKAKEALLEGIKLYPKNEKILDGLMQFYTAEEGVGDPAELVSMIDATLANDPDSYDLWFGRGRVYFKLQNYDECIASFKRCTELRPDDFQSNFYTGYFFIEKGNAMLDELNKNVNMSNQAYNEAAAAINSVYAEAIPWLEKAHELNSSDAGTVEYLKNICFRLRDEGMQSKYEKYNEIFKTMMGQ